ncbi:MAG: hypothetical protein Fur0037_15380 [Planctomycetota bacterium]
MLCQAMPPEVCARMRGEDIAAGRFWARRCVAFGESPRGPGVDCRVFVEDADACHAKVVANGGNVDLPPKSQFCGIRDFAVTDPNGFLLTFYSPIAMQSCHSCGTPLAGPRPGQMYCDHCADENSNLRPYEQVLEGTTNGYFMGVRKL